MTPTALNTDVPFDEEKHLCQELCPTSTSLTIYLAEGPRLCMQESVQLCEYRHGEFWATDLEHMASQLRMMFQHQI